MPNQHGFDINNPMNWYLYERSQPNLRQRDPSGEAANKQALEASNVDQHAANVGEWLMNLPFTFAPTRQKVDFLPNVGYFILNKAPYLTGIPEWSRDNAATKGEDNSRNNKIWARSSDYKPIDLNESQKLEAPLPSLSAKTKLDMFFGAARAIGQLKYLIPEPLKKPIPPHVRALVHYIAGHGEPTDLGIDSEQLDRLSSQAYNNVDDWDPALENGFKKTSEHVLKNPRLQKALRDINPELLTPTGELNKDIFDPSRVTNTDDKTGGQLHQAINAYYPDIARRVVLDDYRFYDFKQQPFANSPKLPEETSYQEMYNGLLEVLKHPGSVQGNSDFRAALARYGTPYPVFIKYKKE